MAGAALDEPARRLDAKAAEAAGDEMRTGWINFELFASECPGRPILRRRPNQDLAHVTGLLHQPYRLDDIGAFKHRVGERRKIALSEALQNIAEQFSPDLGAREQHLVEIDPKIAQIATERPQADRRVRKIVALAQFDETPEWLQKANAALHRLTGE